MNNNEKIWLSILEELVQLSKTDQLRSDRTNTGTFSTFGKMLKFDIRDGSIPILTSKKIHLPSIIHEVLWYFMGTGNIQYLTDNKVKIWNEWANSDGDLGPVYGVQWRNWPGREQFHRWEDGRLDVTDSSRSDYTVTSLGVKYRQSIDQIQEAIHLLKTNPTSRRILVTAWNPAYLPNTSYAPCENPVMGLQALPPCHYGFQLYAKELTDSQRLERWNSLVEKAGYDWVIRNDTDLDKSLPLDILPKYELSLLLTQRSCDYFLGGAFNVASYSLILRMFCEVTNMFPGDFVWSLGDVHLYSNHVEQAEEQLARPIHAPPQFSFCRSIKDIDDFKYSDFYFGKYTTEGLIRAPVAI